MTRRRAASAPVERVTPLEEIDAAAFKYIFYDDDQGNIEDVQKVNLAAAAVGGGVFCQKVGAGGLQSAHITQILEWLKKRDEMRAESFIVLDWDKTISAQNGISFSELLNVMQIEGCTRPPSFRIRRGSSTDSVGGIAEEIVSRQKSQKNICVNTVAGFLARNLLGGARMDEFRARLGRHANKIYILTSNESLADGGGGTGAGAAANREAFLLVINQIFTGFPPNHLIYSPAGKKGETFIEYFGRGVEQAGGRAPENGWSKHLSYSDFRRYSPRGRSRRVRSPRRQTRRRFV